MRYVLLLLMLLNVVSCCCRFGQSASGDRIDFIEHTHRQDRQLNTHIVDRIDFMGTFLKWMSMGDVRGVPTTFTRDQARRAGYMSDTHPLVTDDDYLVRLTRIHGRGPFKRRPVLLMHGLSSSADHWIIRGPKKDLPYILADLGHDVWIGDWRGNYFASKHRFLSTSDPHFWNFSYYHRALHDLPLMIDYVLKNDKCFSQIFYLGYSFGTAALMVLTAEMPEYNSKIKMGFLMAPIGYPIKEFVHPAVELASENIVATHNQTDLNVMYSFFPRYSLFVQITRMACKVAPQMCWELMFLLFGQRRQNMAEVDFQAFVDRAPSGTSSLDVIYLQQIYQYGFRGYDFGERYNLEVYGHRRPPVVPVENITVPLALFYSPTDHLNSEEGVIGLANRLRNVVLLRKIGIPDFSHLDYMCGKNVEKVLYNEIVWLMGSAETGTLPAPRWPKTVSKSKRKSRSLAKTRKEALSRRMEPFLKELRQFLDGISKPNAPHPSDVMKDVTVRDMIRHYNTARRSLGHEAHWMVS